MTDEQKQALWNEACKDTPQAPGWNRHIRYAASIESAATAPLLERIAELTEEVERFRADALNEKAARRELEAKIAQQAEAQEPVAWANFTEDGNIRIWSKKPESANWCGLTLVPLFTRPQPAQLQALSEEEIVTAWRGVKDVGDDKYNAILLSEAIQSALAAKNGEVLK